MRYFYPNVPIRLLAGGQLERGLAAELQLHWNVQLEDIQPGDYGWGFVKLEPLFGRPGERFLVIDSDTVLTGAVLGLWPSGGEPFLVDDEDQSEADAKRLYYDWDRLRDLDSRAEPPLFVFNSGQWFGTAGVLSRDDFDPWIEWSMPRRLRHAPFFMPSDQGVLNYVINSKVARAELRVQRRKIMRWPGHGMAGITARTVADGTAPPLIVHWAGFKRPFLSDLPGADVLRFFESRYYERLHGSGRRRAVANVRYPVQFWRRQLATRMKQRFGLE